MTPCPSELIRRFVHVEAGSDDEIQGLTQYTFTRADGTQLGTPGECA
jgi:hypothetical protein